MRLERIQIPWAQSYAVQAFSVSFSAITSYWRPLYGGMDSTYGVLDLHQHIDEARPFVLAVQLSNENEEALILRSLFHPESQSFESLGDHLVEADVDFVIDIQEYGQEQEEPRLFESNACGLFHQFSLTDNQLSIRVFRASITRQDGVFEYLGKGDILEQSI